MFQSKQYKIIFLINNLKGQKLKWSESRFILSNDLTRSDKNILSRTIDPKHQTTIAQHNLPLLWVTLAQQSLRCPHLSPDWMEKKQPSPFEACRATWCNHRKRSNSHSCSRSCLPPSPYASCKTFIVVQRFNKLILIDISQILHFKLKVIFLFLSLSHLTHHHCLHR